MRVRKIRGIEEEIEKIAGDKLILKPEDYRGKWHKIFGNNNPIFIEIGCGKGQFITGLSRMNKDINYVAIEKVEEILYKTALKLDNDHNLRLLLTDGRLLTEIFDDNEIDGIYLNFSDPWPKNRHHKRRLTSMDFLNQYKRVLKKDGRVNLKTDNSILFEYSLNTFAKSWRLENISLNYIHSSQIIDVETEYENKFRKKGNSIYRLEAINIKEGE
ncbi:MAG: tRNA (guanosine(46)-N7)-methyltransferase TrmB [Firmicutes bacterium]|nr:tRNA (guanosine(46)-N7)-methyltransferase TrmB [Bacillota bacterium]